MLLSLPVCFMSCIKPSSGFPMRSDTNHLRLYSLEEGKSFEISDLGNKGIYEAKTKALISCTVTVHLICGFAFAHAKRRFSHNTALRNIPQLLFIAIHLFLRKLKNIKIVASVDLLSKWLFQNLDSICIF